MPTHCLNLALLLLVTRILGNDKYDNPKNVVGLVGGEVVLECHRNTTSEVVWTYKKPGQDDETSLIPGRYRKELTSYGEHRLILENLNFTDAGTYVCSSAANPVAFRKAAAYLVVVADRPHCTNNLATTSPSDGDTVSLTCWVSYVGVPYVIGVNMTWIGPDGRTVTSEQFQADAGRSVRSMRADVRVDGVFMLPHRCLVTFNILREYDDVDNNVPNFVSGNSCFSPVERISVRPVGGQIDHKYVVQQPTETEKEQSLSLTIAVTVLSTVCAVLFLALICVPIRRKLVSYSGRRFRVFCVECRVVSPDSAARTIESQTDPLKTEIETQTLTAGGDNMSILRAFSLQNERSVERHHVSLNEMSPNSGHGEHSDGDHDDERRPFLRDGGNHRRPPVGRQVSNEDELQSGAGHGHTDETLELGLLQVPVAAIRLRPVADNAVSPKLPSVRVGSRSTETDNDDTSSTSRTPARNAEFDLQEDRPEPFEDDVNSPRRPTVDTEPSTNRVQNSQVNDAGGDSVHT